MDQLLGSWPLRLALLARQRGVLGHLVRSLIKIANSASTFSIGAHLVWQVTRNTDLATQSRGDRDRPCCGIRGMIGQGLTGRDLPSGVLLPQCPFGVDSH